MKKGIFTQLLDSPEQQLILESERKLAEASQALTDKQVLLLEEALILKYRFNALERLERRGQFA